jgi:hypothetical protein
MSLAIRLVPEALRSIAFGAIGNTYMGIGTAFLNPIRIMHLQNLTNVALLFSFDGINDHLALPGSGFFLLDVTSNKTLVQGFFIAEGQRIYTKYIGSDAPVSGLVYLSAFYGTD